MKAENIDLYASLMHYINNLNDTMRKVYANDAITDVAIENELEHLKDIVKRYDRYYHTNRFMYNRPMAQFARMKLKRYYETGHF